MPSYFDGKKDYRSFAFLGVFSAVANGLVRRVCDIECDGLSAMKGLRY
ncbi:hypothetical protein L665_00423 [Ralstonia solanacearum SD54]|nr:hypothetical protein L665_00423 [Ralstonia solanacearum SD54]